MDQLAILAEGFLQQIVVNETGIGQRTKLAFDCDGGFDLDKRREKLKSFLEGYGLTLQPAKRKVEAVFVEAKD